MQPNSINSGLGTMFPAACQGCEEVRHRQQSPYRLVVRTSRCGRDNPGSTPGGDIWMLRGCEFAIPNVFVAWQLAL